MRFLFWLLALFTLAVALVLGAKNPGFVLFVYPPYRVELSLTLFVLALLALLTLAYFAIRLGTTLLHLPSHVRQYREQRALNQGRLALMEALTAYFEGRYTAAEKTAAVAIKAGDSSGLATIIAAHAAHELREFDKRDSYLAAAENQSVAGNTMRLIAQTEFMLEQKQPQLALHNLRELENINKNKHLGAIRLELKAQQQAHNWDGALATVANLEKRSAIDANAANLIRQQAWMEKLKAQPQNMQTLQSTWNSMPKELRHDQKIAALAAGAYIKLRECKAARQILTENLNHQWNSDLVTLYGDCQDNENTGQIEQAEKWLKLHSHDAGLLLALGKLCLHHGLWGKAQNYLDASNSLKPSRAAYSALAQLAEKLHKPGEALNYNQRAREFD